MDIPKITVQYKINCTYDFDTQGETASYDIDIINDTKEFDKKTICTIILLFLVGPFFALCHLGLIKHILLEEATYLLLSCDLLLALVSFSLGSYFFIISLKNNYGVMMRKTLCQCIGLDKRVGVRCDSKTSTSESQQNLDINWDKRYLYNLIGICVAHVLVAFILVSGCCYLWNGGGRTFFIFFSMIVLLIIVAQYALLWLSQPAYILSCKEKTISNSSCSSWRLSLKNNTFFDDNKVYINKNEFINSNPRPGLIRSFAFFRDGIASSIMPNTEVGDCFDIGYYTCIINDTDGLPKVMNNLSLNFNVFPSIVTNIDITYQIRFFDKTKEDEVLKEKLLLNKNPKGAYNYEQQFRAEIKSEIEPTLTNIKTNIENTNLQYSISEFLAKNQAKIYTIPHSEMTDEKNIRDEYTKCQNQIEDFLNKRTLLKSLKKDDIQKKIINLFNPESSGNENLEVEKMLIHFINKKLQEYTMEILSPKGSVMKIDNPFTPIWTRIQCVDMNGSNVKIDDVVNRIIERKLSEFDNSQILASQVEIFENDKETMEKKLDYLEKLKRDNDSFLAEEMKNKAKHVRTIEEEIIKGETAINIKSVENGGEPNYKNPRITGQEYKLLKPNDTQIKLTVININPVTLQYQGNDKKYNNTVWILKNAENESFHLDEPVNVYVNPNENTLTIERSDTTKSFPCEMIQKQE